MHERAAELRHLLLPLGFLLLQAIAFSMLPSLAGATAYVVMVVAPLLAAAAAVWRGRAEAAPARSGWFVVATALVSWAAGAFFNLRNELILGRANEMYRDSMLAFNLATVPVTFLLASEWSPAGRRLVRGLDAVLALALGYAYFLFTWSMLAADGPADASGVSSMIWLYDAQNLYIACGALVRWFAADDSSERDLFRALAAYAVVYTVVGFFNNHFAAGDPAFGPEVGSIVTGAFALFSIFALRPPGLAFSGHPSASLVRAVRSASPLMLAGALLLVSLFLIRVNYVFGAAGILIAVLGHGLRSTVAQVRHIERGDKLQRDRSELQTMAWTDALTGVANRRFLDHALGGAERRESLASHPLSVLMIDVDHFKLLNDRYGHLAGDACLRAVAQALRQALVRPGDVLARYGGEELIALLQEADSAGAMVVAERLRVAVEALRIEHVGSPARVVTVSIGAASTAMRGDATATNLIAAADKALYEAKCAGRNQVRGMTVETAWETNP
jgi:diguanylate cyclase (GGDEF)-like protein